jgi:hypothetical protein
LIDCKFKQAEDESNARPDRGALAMTRGLSPRPVFPAQKSDGTLPPDMPLII